MNTKKEKKGAEDSTPFNASALKGDTDGLFSWGDAGDGASAW